MMGRVWMVFEGIEGEGDGPTDEWWLYPYVSAPCPLTGDASMVMEYTVNGRANTPETKGPYSSARAAVRWCLHWNKKESR